MSSLKLKDRVENYYNISDIKLLPKVPVITIVNGRSFANLTSLLNKPYSEEFASCAHSTMLMLCNMIEGAFFAYSFNDEIIIISRNDQTNETLPWFDNKIQKICSLTASISTSHFNVCAKSIKLELMDEALFTSQVFAVPSLAEAINLVIYKQQQNFYSSLQFACFYSLSKKFDKQSIKDMLSGLSLDEKHDLLLQECGVNFNDYATPFKRGVACYKSPKLIDGILKNKWSIDLNLPIFTKDLSFLQNLFKFGQDIYRK
jgi:tRNA(His) guanylyltransferase